MAIERCLHTSRLQGRQPESAMAIIRQGRHLIRERARLATYICHVQISRYICHVQISRPGKGLRRRVRAATLCTTAPILGQV